MNVYLIILSILYGLGIFGGIINEDLTTKEKWNTTIIAIIMYALTLGASGVFN